MNLVRSNTYELNFIHWLKYQTQSYDISITYSLETKKQTKPMHCRPQIEFNQQVISLKELINKLK